MRISHVVSARKKVFLILSACAFLICCFVESPIGVANAATLTVPDVIYPGQGFLVDVAAAPEEVGADSLLVLEWNGKSIPVPMTSGKKKKLKEAVLRGQILVALHMDATKAHGDLRLLGPKGDALAWHTVNIQPKKYPEQHLKVKRKYVKLSQKNLDRHYAEKAKTVKALKRLTPERMWKLPFIRPVKGGVSSPFGVRRFFNGEPRKPHSGVDLRGKKGTPVKATAAGIVRLTGNHFFSGNVVYIDHGMGVVSMYAHLSKVLVKQGQKVAAGAIIGEVGSTGRVTGPHLHFGVSIQQTLVDAMPLFNTP